MAVNRTFTAVPDMLEARAEEVANAVGSEHDKNNELNRQSFAAARWGEDPETIREVMFEAASRSGQNLHAAKKTIENGIRDGLKERERIGDTSNLSAADQNLLSEYLAEHNGRWPDGGVTWLHEWAVATGKITQPDAPAGRDDEMLPGIDAADLLELDIPPLRWAIPGLLPAGLGILAAPPKAGKSLLCYQLAVSLVNGTALFEGYEPENRRPVLYFALEDGYRRAKARVVHALRDQRINRGLRLEFETTALGNGLEDSVANWLDAHDEGMVIIDVLAKVRPKPNGKEGNAYDADYSALSRLHRVAKEHPGAVILVVTHDRKAGSADYMTRITGTRGVTGVADFNLFLDRPAERTIHAELRGAGRDLEDIEGLHIELVDGRWERDVTPIDRTGTTILSERDRMLQFMLEHPMLSSPGAIAEEWGVDSAKVSAYLSHLQREGKVARTGHGVWSVVYADPDF